MNESEKPLLKRYTGNLLTIKQVASILCVSTNSVRKWCEKGLLEAIPLPRLSCSQRQHWRVRGSAIDKIIKSGGRLLESETEKE